MIDALADGAALAAGIDLPAYTHIVARVPEPLRAALLADLAGAPAPAAPAQ